MTEPEFSEGDRVSTRRLVDAFGPVEAAELLGLSPSQLCHIVLGLPVTPSTATNARAGLAQVASALDAVAAERAAAQPGRDPP